MNGTNLEGASGDLRLLLQRVDRRGREEALELARALHDDPLQLLAAAIMRIALARARLPGELAGALDEVESLTRRALEQVREASRRLGSVSATRYGLPGALQNLVERQAERLEVDIRAEIETVPAPSLAELSEAILEAVSDLLVAVAGSRDRGSVGLRYGREPNGDLAIRVEANGFDPEWNRSGNEVPKHGIDIVARVRAALRVYDAGVESEPAGGGGQRVTITVPEALVDRLRTDVAGDTSS